MFGKGAGRRLMVFMILAVVFLLVLVFVFPAFGAEKKEPPSVFRQWWDWVWRVLNFVILAYFVYRLGRGPVAKFFVSQRESRSRELAELESARDEAKRVYSETLRRLSELPARVEELEAGFRDRCDRIRESELERSRVAAELILSRARDSAAGRYRRAEARLRAEIVELAAAEAEREIREVITDQDRRRLVEEYVAQVRSS